MGAYLAARLALEDERAKKLVLISSNTLAPKGSAESQAKSQRHAEELRRYTPSMENMRQMTFGTIYHRELVTEELVRERYEMSAGNNYQAQLKRYEAPRSRPLEERLPDLKCKTLIIWGKNDHGTSVEQAWLLFQKIPRAELHIFDEAAHWVHWDHAERVNGLIKSFLSGADS
jgi:pimeloyl-ACP methyl ester carboxylesterase